MHLHAKTPEMVAKVSPETTSPSRSTLTAPPCKGGELDATSPHLQGESGLVSDKPRGVGEIASFLAMTFLFRLLVLHS